MNLSEIKMKLDEVLEVENQESWDNSGLLIGDLKQKINNVVIALELTKDVLELAIEKKLDLIITHHPAIFSPLKNIIDSEVEENYIFKLISHNIALYSAHTNFDKLKDGMGNYIGRLIKGYDYKKVENSEYGTVFKVEPVKVSELGERLIDILGLENINVSGNIEKIVEHIAVVTGAGADMYSLIKDSGAQLFITGDVKYHLAQDSLKADMVIFDIGHYGSEKIFPQVFVEKCASIFKEVNLECYTGNQNPFKLITRR